LTVRWLGVDVTSFLTIFGPLDQRLEYCYVRLGNRRRAGVPDTQFILNNTMAITSRHGGFIKEFDVAMGDKVKEGSLVLTLEVAGDAASLQNALARVVRFRRSRPFKKNK
jgi:hypothetical protein